MLGERVTTEITKNKDAQGFPECKIAAQKGGQVAGKARIDAEKEIGASIITKENYITTSEKKRE